MDSAELTGWMAWEQYKAEQQAKVQPRQAPQPVMGGLA